MLRQGPALFAQWLVAPGRPFQPAARAPSRAPETEEKPAMRQQPDARETAGSHKIHQSLNYRGIKNRRIVEKCETERYRVWIRVHGVCQQQPRLIVGRVTSDRFIVTTKAYKSWLSATVWCLTILMIPTQKTMTMTKKMHHSECLSRMVRYPRRGTSDEENWK